MPGLETGLVRRLWIAASGAGLVSFEQGRFQVHDVARGFPHNEVRQLLADPDGGWVDAGHAREARFAALPPGDYRFRVAASQDGWRWRELDAPLAEWRRAARAQSALALVIADIDAFKAYNDSLGHLEGDRCLSAVAQVIRECASRAGDFAARFGGEEFVVLIPGADAAAATAFAERLRQACQARALPHPASPVAPVVTLSLGVASTRPSAEGRSAQLLAAADAALYRAKAQGRNRVVCAPAAPDA